MTTAKEISDLTRAARKARIGTLLQLQIAAELLNRGECTFISMMHSFGVNLEAIAYSCAGLVANDVIKVTTCRDSQEYSIARLTPTSTEILKEFLSNTSTAPSKKEVFRRYSRL